MDDHTSPLEQKMSMDLHGCYGCHVLKKTGQMRPGTLTRVKGKPK